MGPPWSASPASTRVTLPLPYLAAMGVAIARHACIADVCHGAVRILGLIHLAVDVVGVEDDDFAFGVVGHDVGAVPDPDAWIRTAGGAVKGIVVGGEAHCADLLADLKDTPQGRRP